MTVWPSPASLTGSSAGSVSTCPPRPLSPHPSPLRGANWTLAPPVPAGLYTWVFLESQSPSPKVRTGGLWTQVSLPSSAPLVISPSSPSYLYLALKHWRTPEPSQCLFPTASAPPLPSLRASHSPFRRLSAGLHQSCPGPCPSLTIISHISSDLRAPGHTPNGPIKVLNPLLLPDSPVSVPN